MRSAGQAANARSERGAWALTGRSAKSRAAAAGSMKVARRTARTQHKVCLSPPAIAWVPTPPAPGACARRRAGLPPTAVGQLEFSAARMPTENPDVNISICLTYASPLPLTCRPPPRPWMPRVRICMRRRCHHMPCCMHHRCVLKPSSSAGLPSPAADNKDKVVAGVKTVRV